MSGTAIIGALLRAHAPLTAVVPLARIKGGRLPEGVTLPAILVRSISLLERQPLEVGAFVRVTERVSATVRAASYREQQAIVRLMGDACRGRTGMIAERRGVAVTDAGVGPDVAGPGNSFERARDFRVGFDEPTSPEEN